MARWVKVETIVEHSYEGSRHYVGEVYDVKPHFGKLLHSKGYIAYLGEKPIKKQSVKRKRKV